MRFTTDAFVGDYFNWYMVIGFLTILAVVVVAVVCSGIEESLEKKGKQFNEKTGITLGVLGFLFVIIGIILIVTGFVHENNVEKDQGLVVAVDLAEAGYASPMNLNVGSLITGSDTTFDYIKNDEIVSCELFPMREPSEFKVVCID